MSCELSKSDIASSDCTRAFSRGDVLVAIAAGQITTLYQPQMSADGAKICGVEALARWRHPTLGMIGPGQFVPQLNGDAEAVQALSEAVLRQACRDGREWNIPRVAVNIDPLQFAIDDLADRIEVIAASEGFPLDRLEIEILETSYFDDPARVQRVLARLRRAGISVALDDFGTGYSSLSCLLQLPLDKLKIDASFVRNVDQLRSAAVIHAIVALSRSIGLKVTAEGVETREQARFLKIAGCHFLQGFYFARAITAEEVSAMLANPVQAVARKA
jgi:EAL domain-containing protein (putative c-di-GMP-specific phosphodiesterase class I)